ncbi:hypothetical protein ACE5IS_08815 [Leptospira wolffii]|uniref:STAS domain-containing protein n=1 Tax=Leptospira wolffii TaxID=409998 RepID=A0A2M9ZBB7_9LEPT|nr:hypothetical protein [Leptospira wolffii]EPG66672.1 hypothetical protein LEP1GSC061_1408 [Leptospira wolffii serovar Khorat str. Khorat-H2]PJZ65723.1 hypothetical protein CH371_12445 [Leptospira wolffii]TGK56058.1 hypothetical protein EHQ32_16725 [Leptospira wolffii]TGK72104.1 hypothetical protein EHQ35_12160 [Leptospira wolffii]TGK73769.1 hypothetical protein EHQ27_06790 [Leptospira wolffii]
MSSAAIQFTETHVYADKKLFRVVFVRNVCAVETEEIGLILHKIQEVQPNQVELDLESVVAIPSLILNRILKLLAELKSKGVPVEIKTSEGLKTVLNRLKISLQ